MTQQLNYKNLSVAATITTITGLILLAASFLFNKESFFLLFNHDFGGYADAFFAAFTHLGETIPWVAALALILLFKKDFFWLLLACFFISTLFVQGIKNILPEQPRPTKAITSTYQVHTVKGVELHKEFSFPSGHTATAFTVFFIACLAIDAWWILPVGFAYALLVGYSRVYLAQHFPRDIAGGMLIAVLAIYLSLWVCKKRIKE